MHEAKRQEGGEGEMYEAIVGKILAAAAATRRIYGRQRHFAPKWLFGSRNGGGEIVGLHATNACCLTAYSNAE